MKAIWAHEICGGSPVQPKTWICMKCKGPVFPEECIKVGVSDIFIRDHPTAVDYLVDLEEKI